MKYCTRCILPETYPGISFNEEGICNFCVDYKSYHPNLGKERLKEVLLANNKSGDYDCIVPLSGGKDSSFILYYVVKELGLKPLAVSYNSGYQKTIAEENVRNACKKLNVPLRIIESPGNLQKKRLKVSYLISQREKNTWGTCANCEAIIRTISANTARKLNIPFVIWGSSGLESMDVKKYTAYNLGKKQKDKKQNWLSFGIRVIKAGIKDPVRVFLYGQSVYFNIIQRFALGFPLKYAIKPNSVPPLSTENPKFILFFEYINWDSMENIRLLENELGWKHPVGIDSRFDCSLHCVVNYNKLQEWGITQDGVNFCNFIREGKMSREKAIKMEEYVVNSIGGDYKELVEKILD